MMKFTEEIVLESAGHWVSMLGSMFWRISHISHVSLITTVLLEYRQYMWCGKGDVMLNYLGKGVN